MNTSPAAGAPAVPVDPLSLALCQALEHLGASVTLKDAGTGQYLFASASAPALLGWSRTEAVGCTDVDLLDGATAATLRAADSQAQASGAPVRTEHQLAVGGQRIVLQAQRTVLPPSEGSGPRLLCVWTSTETARRKDEQLKTALAQLESQQAAFDELRREFNDHQVRDPATGLYQRPHFEEQVRREVDLSVREQREFALVIMAADGIDALAQAQGPAAADLVCETLGRLLRAKTRVMDAPCRLDAQRFAVLLSGVGLATAHSRMEGLRRQCTTHIVAYQGQELHFSVSMGIASFPHTASTLEDIEHAAETALAEAVRKGGNRVALAAIRFEPR